MYQSVAVLSSYNLHGQQMPPHDYLDDLESFFYVLCRIMFSTVSKGKSVHSRIELLLEQWASDPETAAGAKERFIMSALKPAHIDSTYWGEACMTLLHEFHTFIQSIVKKKDVLTAEYGDDDSARITNVRKMGGDIERHYDHLDSIFRTAMAKLETEELEIEVRLATAANSSGAQSRVPERYTSPLADHAARKANRNLKRGSEDVEGLGTSKRANKRHTSEKSGMAEDDTMDTD